MAVNQVERSRLQPSSCVGDALVRLYTVVKPQVEIHVLSLDSERGAQIHARAGDAIVGRARQLAHVPKRASKSSTHVEGKAVEGLRGGGGDSKPTKGKQEQHSLTQS